MDKQFIKTTDLPTANRLKSEGLTCISEQNNIFTFLNNGKLTFSDNKKIIFTNKLEL